MALASPATAIVFVAGTSAWNIGHKAEAAALSSSSTFMSFNGCYWLSIVSFADSPAAGKQPAEYPDPGLIQIVDKNGRVYGACIPTGGSKLCLVSVSLRLRGCADRLTQLTPHVKGAKGPSGPSLFHILQDQNEPTARKRDLLVLQLDTFGETIGRIPMSRGKRLHVL